MDARVLVEALQNRGLSIALVGDKVRVQGTGEPDPDTKALLQELKEQKETVKSFLGEPDPMLLVAAWYPHFRDFHHKTVSETSDFDYSWLRQHRSELYRLIKAKENEIDALGAARLSHVMALLREWRELVLTACFDQQAEARKQDERTK
jgi:hypothetical protein